MAATRARLERLGFTPTVTTTCRWRLRDREHSARAASAVFAHGYLDVIEIPTEDWARHVASSSIYASGSAPSGIVLGVDADAGAEAEALGRCRARVAERGAEPRDPYEIVREVPGARPGEIHYWIFAVRDGGLPLAVIADPAPHVLRTAEWLDHASSAAGVERFHLRVPSSTTARAGLERVLGRALAPDAPEIDLEATRLVLHEEPADPYLAAVSARLPRRDVPALLAVDVAVTSLDRAARALTSGRVRFDRAGGRLEIDPADGFGCGLRFVSAGDSGEDGRPA